MSDFPMPTMRHVVEKSNLTLKPTGTKGLLEFTYAQYVKGWDKVPEEERKTILRIFREFIGLIVADNRFKLQTHPQGPAATGTVSYRDGALLAVWLALDDARNFSGMTFPEGQHVHVLARAMQKQMNLIDAINHEMARAKVAGEKPT